MSQFCLAMALPIVVAPSAPGAPSLTVTPEIFSGNYFEAKITVIPDEKIKQGGVVVETSNGLIDATIDTQLAIIAKALNGKEEN